MTLEDFFTLTEMKDGLTATSRVEELVAFMQKEKNSVVNPGDAIRQWAAVAGIIATTDSKDCLDLFVQLGGLWFIDRWLKDAENFGSNNGDNFVDESITALLLALEKLCIDKEKSVSSGIWVTVCHLVDHNNVQVQDRARAVVDFWNQRDGWKRARAVSQQIEGSAPVNERDSDREDVGREAGEMERSPSSIPSREEKEDVEGCASEALRAVKSPLQSSNTSGLEKLDDLQTKEMAMDASSSPGHQISHHAATGHDQDETSDDLKDVEMSGEEHTKDKTCVPCVPQSSSLGETDTEPGNALHEGKKPLDSLSSLGATNALDQANMSSEAEALTSEETSAVPALETKMNSDEGNQCSEVAAISTEAQVETNEVPKAFEENGCSSQADRHASEKLDDLVDSICLKEAGAVKDRYKEISNLSALYGVRKGKKRSKKVRGKKSAIELEYGIVDALDIARQVAKEVEREVTDYKEPFGSTSSERSSGGVFGRERSSDSINGSPSSSVDLLSDESSAEESQFAEGDGRRSMGNGDSNSKDPPEDMISSRVTEDKVKADKGFDLNEEVCLDDGDGMALVDEEPHNSYNQKHKGLEIDLNMAEDGADGPPFPMTGNHLAVSSGVNSKGSSGDANQGRSERFNLDLNSPGGDDDDDVVIICDSQQFPGRICPSPASSSSQMQHHRRNFDLNDQPFSSLKDPFFNQAQYHNSPSCGATSLGKPGGRPAIDPFISIMGTKVDVNRGGVVPPRSSDLSNGKATLEPLLGSNLGLGSAFPSFYSPLSRGSTLPTGQIISFSPYGSSEPSPYVIDPRFGPMVNGAPGPAPNLYSPYPVPSMMSLNAGPSQPHYDLNSRFSVDGANRDPGFLMQLFPPSQVKPQPEHPGAILQPFPGSITGGKRKEPEPEARWDPYRTNYGQYQSPWK